MLIPATATRETGRRQPAGTSKQLLAERPLCFYFCGEARGRRLSLIGVPLRFPFPEGSRPLGTREAKVGPHILDRHGPSEEDPEST